MAHWIDGLTFSNLRGSARPRPKAIDSPYFGLSDAEAVQRTRELLGEQTLDGDTLRHAVLGSWSAIFDSTLGGARIGYDIKPAPQVMGFFLHELVPHRISQTLPDWRRDAASSEKDLVYIPDSSKSIEIKTSSDPRAIFGNRSFGVDNPGRGKKAKSGYYCTINFEKWPRENRLPEIVRIRYGWLDSTDWVAQTAQTGQQSSLPAVIYNTQLPLLFEQT